MNEYLITIDGQRVRVWAETIDEAYRLYGPWALAEHRRALARIYGEESAA